MEDNNIYSSCTYLPQQSSYTEYSGVWDVIDDCIEGDDKIKQLGEKYLHKTVGMIADDLYGNKMYENYKYKAQWYDLPSLFLENLDGLLWQKDPVVNVPTEMDNLFLPAPAFYSNKSFLDVYRETALQVIKYSRHAILLDPPSVTQYAIYPRMIQYDTRQIKHWGYEEYKGQSILKFVLLDESSFSYENQFLSQEIQHKYRFLGLVTKDKNGNPLETPVYYTYTGDANFVAVFDPPFDPSTPSISYQGVDIVFPNIHGKFSDRIPFFCFASTEMSMYPSKPILYPLCKACLSLYRSSADYEEYLFKQSFALLFGKGFKGEDIFVGTHKAITVECKDADLKYVEINGSGLSEQRLAFENKYNYALTIGYGLLTGDNSRTGKTVQNNVSVKAASLKSISKTLAHGFVELCKYAAQWRGLSDEEVNSISILPNMEFTVVSDPALMVNAYTVWKQGGLTDFDYYCLLRNNDKTVYTTFTEWTQALKDTITNHTALFGNTDKKLEINKTIQELPQGEGGDSIPDVKQ